MFSSRKLSFVFWLIGTMLIALNSFHILRPLKSLCNDLEFARLFLQFWIVICFDAYLIIKGEHQIDFFCLSPEYQAYIMHRYKYFIFKLYWTHISSLLGRRVPSSLILASMKRRLAFSTETQGHMLCFYHSVFHDIFATLYALSEDLQRKKCCFPFS